MKTTAAEGRCARCGQPRVLFAPNPAWGRVPGPLCTSDWRLYAEARANSTFVDWNDTFDNGTDEQLAAGLGGKS
ncbi:hypothetical protein [Streptomyces sp. NPDC054887]